MEVVVNLCLESVVVSPASMVVILHCNYDQIQGPIPEVPTVMQDCLIWMHLLLVVIYFQRILFALV